MACTGSSPSSSAFSSGITSVRNERFESTHSAIRPCRFSKDSITRHPGPSRSNVITVAPYGRSTPQISRAVSAGSSDRSSSSPAKFRVIDPFDEIRIVSRREPHRLQQRHGKTLAASRRNHNLDSRRLGRPQRLAVPSHSPCAPRRQQGAVNIDGDHPYGAGGQGKTSYSQFTCPIRSPILTLSAYARHCLS